MSDSAKPPLNPIVQEQISLLLHRIEEKYWAILCAMRVARFIPLSEPVPPQTPEQLLAYLRAYAAELFKTEADSYQEFVNAGPYPAWIGALEERMLRRVLKAVERIESADPNLTLGFHGLDPHRIENELRGTLWEVANPYRWSVPGADVSARLIDAAQESTRKLTKTVEAAAAVAPEDKKLTIAEQIRALQDESNVTAQVLADALEIDPRSVFRHLAGEAIPRGGHIAAYESLFSEKLGRKVTIKTSPKRHKKVIKRQ